MIYFSTKKSANFCSKRATSSGRQEDGIHDLNEAIQVRFSQLMAIKFNFHALQLLPAMANWQLTRLE